MSTFTTRTLVVLISVLVLATVGSQIYFRMNDRHKTEEAVLCSINENIPFKGIVIRDERVVTYPGNGVFEYLYSNGSKVSVGSNIAEVYPSEQIMLNKRKSNSLIQKAEALEKAQNPGTAQYVQPETLNSKINADYRKILNDSVNGRYDQFGSTYDDLFLQLNIYNIITGQSTSYADEIASLRTQAEELSRGADPIGTVTASESGYFVSYCDGYESKLSLDNIDRLNQSDIETVIAGEGSPDVISTAVGKMFDDYACRIIGLVPKDKRIIEGDYIELKLDNSKSYKVKIDSVKDAASEDKSIIIMSCDRLDTDIVKSRVLSFELIFDNYKGIKVPREAIRFKDGQKGVYVILGNEITFKKINVIYEGSDFVVSENTSDEKSLLLYDQILLEAVSTEDETRSDSSSRV